jgi:hypothetical protein
MFKALQQLLLPVTDPIAYIEAMAARREKSRDGRRLRTAAINRFREMILKFGIAEQMDLFNVIGINPAAMPVTRPADAGIIEIATSWSDQAITALCDGLVSSALEGLRDNKGHNQRRELFEWMAPSANADHPFSFEQCCAVSGLNAESIRSFIVKVYREEIRGYVADDEAVKTENSRQGNFAIA